MAFRTLAAPISRLRHILPAGRTLPEPAWRARHVGLVALLWVHAAVVPFYAVIRDFSPTHALLESAILPTTAVLAMSPLLGRRTRTVIASLGLLSSSAILVHLSGGLIEMHFHFFVMVALVALYQDWLPFLAAVGYVFVHHGLLGALDPDSVFNHAAARNNPWKWAGIHALFVTGISVACLVTWRLNELILSQREAAEARLLEETRVVETLHQVGQTLAAELDAHRVVQTVTDAAVELTNASFGAFFYNVAGPTGEAYQLYTLSGAPVEAFDRFGLPRATKIFAPTFNGEQVVRLDDVTADPRYGQMAPHFGMPKDHLPVRSYLAVPVRSRTGEVLGGLFFGHPEPARFTDVDERIVLGIASQAAIAIDNARLYESERNAHAASEAARGRLSVLADASRVLTSSLEVDVVLRDVAELVTRSVADFCAIDLVSDDGPVRRVAVATAAGTPDAPLTTPNDPASVVARVIADGIARVVPEPADGTGPSAASTRGSVVVVPLAGRRDVLGALTLGRADGSLSETDVPFAEELARRTAIAVENARLYARQRTVAETLQHSLLPDRLPEIPGLAAAARYVAGGPDVEIGGDWYDVVQLPGGDIGFVIGDVVGRGEHAAALMGQLRSVLRAYSRDRHPSHEILSRLNELLLAAGPEYMATVLYIVLNGETGVIEWVNAGHPPPLLVAPDGTASFLSGGRGVPIGAMPGARYVPATGVLPVGGTLLLYTDGLVETRSSAIDEGMERLRQAALAAPTEIDAMCSHVMRDALAGTECHDDAALLAVRLLPLGSTLRLTLPAHPHVLAPLRAAMRRWLRELGAGEQESYELLLVAGELCANAIRHASGPSRGEFDICVEFDGAVTIVVRDHGCWRESRVDVGGRGLDIVRACVDELDIVPGPDGTEVRARRVLTADREPVVVAP